MKEVLTTPTLGEVIVQYRKNKKISLRKFAETANISPSYLLCLERGTHPKTNEPITPSFETIQKCSNAMHTDIFALMNEIGLNASRDEALKAGMIDVPFLNSHESVEPFQYISLTNQHLQEALQDRRLLILPFRAPQKGDLVYAVNEEYDMVVMYTITEVDGGVYSAFAEAGPIQFTLFDIDRFVFYDRHKASEAFKTYKDNKKKRRTAP